MKVAAWWGSAGADALTLALALTTWRLAQAVKFMSKKALLKAREFETDGSGRLVPITGLDKVGRRAAAGRGSCLTRAGS